MSFLVVSLIAFRQMIGDKQYLDEATTTSYEIHKPSYHWSETQSRMITARKRKHVYDRWYYYMLPIVRHTLTTNNHSDASVHFRAWRKLCCMNK
jgi:hypothetical protein